MLTRQQLTIINRRTLQYPLQIAEKDYFLTLILQLIYESSLGKILVFKGGTALHHCYLEQYRFSEDLDFSSNQKPIDLDQIRHIFHSESYLKVKKDYRSSATIKIEKLQYTGPLTQPNSLKVEIDFLQNVLLPPQVRKYHNVWGIDCIVQVMDIREICAEKIRAASDRARYRDFYDLFLLLKKYQLDLKEISGYIRKKEIRNPIKLSNIQQNWSIARKEKATALNQIYFTREVLDRDIEAMIQSFPFSEMNHSSM